MAKSTTVNKKIEMLRQRPEFFGIDLAKFIAKRHYEKLKSMGFSNFGDLARVKDINDLHIRSNQAIIDAINDLFHFNNISIYKKPKTIKEKVRKDSKKMPKSCLNFRDKLNKICKNRKIFNLSDFEKIVQEQGFRGKKYKKQNFKNDSDDETDIEFALNRLNFQKYYRQIYLCDYKLKGKTKGYYPDFIALDSVGHVFVIEVKEFSRMAARDTLKKYYAAKNYCDKKGYSYILCTKSFVIYEEIKKFKYNYKIYKFIKDIIKQNGKFTKSDLTKLRKAFKYISDSHMNNEIAKICIIHNYMMKGDLTIDSKKFKIRPLD